MTFNNPPEVCNPKWMSFTLDADGGICGFILAHGKLVDETGVGRLELVKGCVWWDIGPLYGSTYPPRLAGLESPRTFCKKVPGWQVARHSSAKR